MTYKIIDWDKNFENNRTREMKTMSWIPVPNKLDGDGYLALVDQDGGAELFGAWVAIIQVASKCDPRGTLLRSNGTPHTANTLYRITRIPSKIIQKMLTICVSDPKWLEIIDKHQGAENPQDCAVKVPSREQNRTEQNRTEQNRIEQNRTEQKRIEPAYFRVSNILKDRILEFKQQKITIENIKAWCGDVKRMIEIDNRKLEDIEKIINECHDMVPDSSGFTWRKNILSMSALRMRWNEGKIWIGMNKNKSRPQFGRQEVSVDELREQGKEFLKNVK